MEYLHGKKHEVYKKKASELISIFEEHARKLKETSVVEEIRKNVEQYRNTNGFLNLVQELKTLMVTNIPACGLILDEILAENNFNIIQVLQFRHLRFQVSMSCEGFTSARKLADEAFDIVKPLYDNSRQSSDTSDHEFTSEEIYKAYFQSAFDCFLIRRYQGQLEEAEELLEELRKASKLAGSTDDQHKTEIFYGDLLLAKGLLSEAIHDVLRPLRKSRDLNKENKGILLQKIGNACRSAQRVPAYEYLRDSVQIARDLGDEISEYERKADLGNLYRYEGRIADALDLQVLHLGFAFQRGDLHGLTVACFNIGYSYYSISPDPDMEKAMVFLVVQHDLAAQMDNDFLRGVALNNIGKTLCAQNLAQNAIDVFKVCIEIAKKTGNKTGEEKAYGNLGTAYRSLGKLDDAIHYHNKYLQSALDRGDEGGKAIMYRELAWDYFQKGDLNEAKNQALNSIFISEDLRILFGWEDASRLANFDKNQAEAYNLLQVCLAKLGRIEESLAISEFARARAFSDNVRYRHGKSSIPLGNRPLGPVLADDHILSVSLTSGIQRSQGPLAWKPRGTRFHARGHQRKENLLKKLQERSRREACTEKKYANEFSEETIMQEFQDTTEQLKSSFLIYSVLKHLNSKGIQEKWLYIWLVLWWPHVRKKHKGKIIHLRKVRLSEHMNRTKLFDDGGFFTRLRRSYHRHNLLENSGKDDLTALEEIDDEDAEVEQCKLRFTKVSVPNAEAVDELMAALESMHLVEPKQTLDDVGLSSKNAEKDKLPSASTTRQLDQSCRNQDTQKTGRAYLLKSWRTEGEQQLRELYNICIFPVEDILPKEYKGEAPHITIIPHEFLFNVPFAALQRSDGQYLIERFVISYAPSLRALELLHHQLIQHRQKQGERKLEILAVGNPKMASPKLSPLKYSEEEVYAIERIFKHVGNCQIALREDAKKDLILESLANKDVIHIASHAMQKDPKDKQLSKSGDYLMRGCIILAPSGYNPRDGVLLAREIVRRICIGQLVTLSCCETGLGKVTADGVVGLSRAFLAAGASGVVVTLWKILDDFAPKFMELFYEAFLAYREDAAKALQEAMIKCIEEGIDPSQWGAFSYIGASKARKLKKKHSLHGFLHLHACKKQ